MYLLGGTVCAIVITPLLVSVCGCESYHAATVALAAVVSARFANKGNIRRLNRIIGCILLLLGVATIFIKLWLKSLIIKKEIKLWEHSEK